MGKQKKLLVLGGGRAAVDVVLEAKKMGYYVIATDYLETGVAKENADKSYKVSTTDIEGLKKIVTEEKIDGVFCGPSEFNIVNTMNLCEQVNLPFYVTREQWELCSNKERFKELCRKFNVPVIEEYDINSIDNMTFPVIVKPVDGNSSRGITVCYTSEQVKKAYDSALKYSNSKKVIIEKYIDNAGVGVDVRYIANKGDLSMVLVGDTYSVDPFNKTSLINTVGVFPSQYTDLYMKKIDKNVKEMFKSIGINYAVFFLQALYQDGIYFHEMGLRLSGGLPYKFIDAITNVNYMKMMIRYAVGDTFADNEEIESIDPYLKNKIAGFFAIPLKAGKISKVSGMETIMADSRIVAKEQYYDIGECIEEIYIGSLNQFFCRFKFVVDSIEEVAEMINFIQSTIRIEDENENNMLYKYFDTDRLL